MLAPGRRLTSALAPLGLLGLLALLAAGCGGSPHSSSSASTRAQTASTSSSTSATAAQTTSRAQRHRKTTSHTKTASTSSTTTSAATVSTAPPPIPSGTPAAPDGLRQVTGYGSYELCRAGCSGTVPATLRRALHLPGGCGGARTGSPVAPQGGADVRLSSFLGSAWKAARVDWVATGNYRGPVLIRGRRVDGPGAVGFGEGRTPDDELQLLAPGQQPPRVGGGGRAWLSFTRVRGPGCYAYQIDGISFSEVIAFRAQ